MTFRALASVLVGTLALSFSPAATAQEADAETAAYHQRLREDVGRFVQPTNAARGEVLLDMLRRGDPVFSAEVQTFAGGNDQTGPMEGRNIVVEIPGMAEEEGEERTIVLIAHYDAVVLPDGNLSHGLVDNAASVVALIRAIDILGAKHIGHNVTVVFSDQEELGLIGARKWIEANGLDAVDAVVNLDVAAYGDTLMYGLNNGPQSAVVVREVRELCAEAAMSCVGYPNYPPSDDRAFSAAGTPVVSLGFQDEIGAHQMWLAFNGGDASGLADGFTPQVFRVIHSTDDTLERVDPATIERMSRTVAALVEDLSGALQTTERD